MSQLNDFVAALQKINASFYHFTDTRNLDLIRRYGLRSMENMRNNAIPVVATGGNDWSLDADMRSGMDKYVHLCFFDQHPMEYTAKKEGRIGSSVFLKVIPDVLSMDGVLISPVVANKKGAAPEPAEAMIPKLDLQVIYTRTDWKNADIQARLKAARLYEILVPSHIPLAMIRNIPNG